MWFILVFIVELKIKVYIVGFFYFFGIGLYCVINVILINLIGFGVIIFD